MAITIAATDATDQPYRILWRAYVSSDEKCACCPRHFPTGQALIAEDPRGKHVAIGPTCAENHAYRTDRFIPDLTKSLLHLRGDAHDDRKSEGNIVIRAKPTGAFAGIALTREQQRILTVSVLRVRALPAVGINTDPRPVMEELVRKWEQQEFILPALWQCVGGIVAECEANPNYQRGSLAAVDLMTALTVQQWLKAALRTGKMDSYATNKVLSIQQEQQVKRHLTPKQFSGLKYWTAPTGLTPPPIDENWLRERTQIPLFRNHARRQTPNAPGGVVTPPAA